MNPVRSSDPDSLTGLDQPVAGSLPAPQAPRPVSGIPAPVRMLVLNALAVALVLAAWWVVAATGVFRSVPTPAETAEKFVFLLGKGWLQTDILTSMRRVVLGFLIGSAVAVPVGFVMGRYPVGRGLIEPVVQFFRTIPPLALIPAVILTMGIGEVPKVFVIYVAAFLAAVIATFQGVVNVDRTLVNAARVLGANEWTIFSRVVVPAATPYILVGVRIGLGSAWATLVAAEFIGGNAGLGIRLKQAGEDYDLATVFVAIITIGVLGMIMDRLLLLAERRLTGWQEREAA